MRLNQYGVPTKNDNNNKKNPEPNGVDAEFSRTFKDNLMPIPFKLFQITEREGIISKPFHKASLTLTPKLDKDTTTKLQTRGWRDGSELCLLFLKS